MTDEKPPLGEILRAARAAAGWSLSRMATATGYSRSHLSKLETGDKDIRYWHIDAYDKVLENQGVRRRALLIMGAGFVPSELWAELDSPVEPPSKVDTGDLEALDATADLLTGLGLRHGGRASAAVARGQLRYATGLLDIDMSEETRNSLLATVGRLADRAAWSMADIGHLRQADSIYNVALTVTIDPVQRWLTLVNLANLQLEKRNPQNALDLLDRAASPLPVIQFLAESTRARAYADLGDFGRTLRHIEGADEAHAAVDLGSLPVAVQPYASGHEAHAHSAAGRALFVFAQAGHRKARQPAAERLTSAIEAFGPDRSQAIASCRRRLAALVG